MVQMQQGDYLGYSPDVEKHHPTNASTVRLTRDGFAVR